jgi:hypothetical protein
LLHLAWRCRNGRHCQHTHAAFDFRFVLLLAAICRPLLHPKGKKRATLQDFAHPARAESRSRLIRPETNTGTDGHNGWADRSWSAEHAEMIIHRPVGPLERSSSFPREKRLSLEHTRRCRPTSRTSRVHRDGGSPPHMI